MVETLTVILGIAGLAWTGCWIILWGLLKLTARLPSKGNKSDPDPDLNFEGRDQIEAARQGWEESKRELQELREIKKYKDAEIMNRREIEKLGSAMENEKVESSFGHSIDPGKVSVKMMKEKVNPEIKEGLDAFRAPSNRPGFETLYNPEFDELYVRRHPGFTSAQIKPFPGETGGKSAMFKSRQEHQKVALSIVDGFRGWGDGDVRVKRLMNAGFDPGQVQHFINLEIAKRRNLGVKPRKRYADHMDAFRYSMPGRKVKNPKQELWAVDPLNRRGRND